MHNPRWSKLGSRAPALYGWGRRGKLSSSCVKHLQVELNIKGGLSTQQPWLSLSVLLCTSLLVFSRLQTSALMVHGCGAEDVNEGCGVLAWQMRRGE